MPQRDRLRALTGRLLICTAVGVAMAGTAYLSAFYSMRNAPSYRWDHWSDFLTFRTLKAALDDYRKRRGSYPDKLGDLKSTRPDDIRVDESGEVRDAWGRPYEYHAEENSYTLFSLGRDGKPGGDGLDQDPDSRDVPAGNAVPFKLPAVGIPTLRQFTFECPTGGVRLVCAVAGVFAFVACFMTLGPKRKSLTRSLIGLTLTLAACLVTALIMSFIHIPTHH